jgi:uncharacterized membrane protein
MYCAHCQEDVSPVRDMTYRPLNVPRCPRCHLNLSTNHDGEPYQNVGLWNITSLMLPSAAIPTPALDPLMITLRELERAALEHPDDRELARRVNAAKGRVFDYLLSHQSLLIWGARRGEQETTL